MFEPSGEECSFYSPNDQKPMVQQQVAYASNNDYQHNMHELCPSMAQFSAPDNDCALQRRSSNSPTSDSSMEDLDDALSILENESKSITNQEFNSPAHDTSLRIRPISQQYAQNTQHWDASWNTGTHYAELNHQVLYESQIHLQQNNTPSNQLFSDFDNASNHTMVEDHTSHSAAVVDGYERCSDNGYCSSSGWYRYYS